MDPSTYFAAYYTIYPCTCVVLIVAVQLVLHRAGALFLHDAYISNPAMAKAICRLLDVGYYLVCAGYVVMTIHTDSYLPSAGELFETISVKPGFFLLLLGALHVFNLLLLAVFRRRISAQPAVS